MAEKLLRDTESIYVAGPYTADPDNCTDRAIEVGNEVRELGFTPFIPHLFHFWHQRFERHYKDWLDMDFHWLDRCDALLSIRGDSPGSDLEWERAGSQDKMRFLGLDGLKDRLTEEGLVICLIGPSGVGKTTLANELQSRVPAMQETTSHTSRLPREGEVDGEEYHFVSLGEMERMRLEGEFLEHTEYSGNLYGFTASTFEDAFVQRNDVVTVVDKRGYGNIKDAYPGQVIGVHVVPPNLAALRDRMEADGRSESDINQRITKAVSEVSDLTGWDYTLVNNDLENAVKNLAAIYANERRKRNQSLRTSHLSPERRPSQEQAS